MEGESRVVRRAALAAVERVDRVAFLLSFSQLSAVDDDCKNCSLIKVYLQKKKRHVTADDDDVYGRLLRLLLPGTR